MYTYSKLHPLNKTKNITQTMLRNKPQMSKARVRGDLTRDLREYYARLQTPVASGLGLPSGRLAGPHTDAAPKHSLC